MLYALHCRLSLPMLCAWDEDAPLLGDVLPHACDFKDDTTGCGVFGFLRICRKATIGGEYLPCGSFGRSDPPFLDLERVADLRYFGWVSIPNFPS